jgi:hypothetical protein
MGDARIVVADETEQTSAAASSGQCLIARYTGTGGWGGLFCTRCK